jgi:hypothetical protein
MKLFIGCRALSLGLVLLAETAHAQVAPPQESSGAVRAVSDFYGPYGAAPQEFRPYATMPPQAPPYGALPPQVPPYAAVPPRVPEPAYGPALLPPAEVYAILRQTGFRPIGVPRQRGMLYLIAVADRYGDEGRLVIDARTGQIVRFVPAYPTGDLYGAYNAAPGPYGPPGRPQAFGDLRDPPRPPASIPKLASRVPMPKPAPPRGAEDKPLAEKPAQPAQQSAAVQAKPVDTPDARVAPPVTETRPAAPPIRPTQPMPSVQGLE